MWRGSAGSAPASAAARRCGCRPCGTRRRSGTARPPRSSSARETAAPRRWSSASSRSNSRGASATSWPARYTVRDAGLTSISPKRSTAGMARRLAPGAPRSSARHPRDQLERPERLGDVVVGADARRPGPCWPPRPGRSAPAPARRRPSLAQRAEHAIAVEPGQHQVEDDEVGVAARRLLEPGGAVARDRDREALVLERGRAARTPGPRCPRSPGSGSCARPPGTRPRTGRRRRARPRPRPGRRAAASARRRPRGRARSRRPGRSGRGRAGSTAARSGPAPRAECRDPGRRP